MFHRTCLAGRVRAAQARIVRGVGHHVRLDEWNHLVDDSPQPALRIIEDAVHLDRIQYRHALHVARFVPPLRHAFLPGDEPVGHGRDHGRRNVGRGIVRLQASPVTFPVLEDECLTGASEGRVQILRQVVEFSFLGGCGVRVGSESVDLICIGEAEGGDDESPKGHLEDALKRS